MKKTNRTFKRFAAITSASLLAACALMPAVSFAVDPVTYTITITNDVAGHTYEAYQIFSGGLSADGTTLSNIEWGNGVTAEALSKITALDLYKSCTDAASVAKILSDNNSDANAIAFANAISTALGTATASTDVHVDTDSDGTADSYVITDTDLTAGYYLIKDADNTQNKENGAYTSFILKVIKNETTGVKTGLPTVVKKVQENSDVNDYSGNGETRLNYNDVADYSIGNNVPFALYGTMPENISSYSAYKYIFHDTLSAGLAFNNDVKVYVGEDLVNSGYTVNHENGNLTVSFDDIKSLKKLVDGTEQPIAISNTSVIRVDYTAKLDTDANIGWDGNPNEVYLEYSNNPNAGGSGNTGTTTKDYVIVYTYGIDIDKVNQADQNEKLSGAIFLLYNEAKTHSATITDGKFVEWVEGDAGTPLTSDENGNIKVAGLDKGKYYMKETKAPDKFNLPEGDKAYFEVNIIAETANGQNWNGTSCALTSLTDDTEVKDDAGVVTEAKDGYVESKITNTKGNVLPGTGGIGTTIFYLGGGAMAAIGGIYLISKRRMKKSEE